MPFINPIVGGKTLIREAIQSPNYVAGVTGWSINKDGSAEFSNVAMRGLGNGDIVIIGPTGKPQVVIGSDASNGYIKLPSNGSKENSISKLIATLLNSGAADEQEILRILGPTTINNNYGMGVELKSGADNGGSGGARLDMYPVNSGTVDTPIMSLVGPNGLNLTRYVYAVADMNVQGTLSASNLWFDETTITPSAANVPTSKTMSIGPVAGTNFICLMTAQTSVPGTTVLGVGYTALSSTSVKLWLTRSNTTTTTIDYVVIGY